jgi:hypothetical protein
VLNGGILALRRRSLWEAADAGLLLWRRNLGYFILFFAIPFWICAFTLLLLGNSGLVDLSGSFSGFPLLCAWFVLWWLNPLFDRLVLHVAAKRYFEPGSSFRALLHGLGSSLGRGLAGDLLWRRFSPWRAVVMPLRVLEQDRRIGEQKRRRIADRKRALANGGLHFCIFLSVWCSLLQWILMGGELLFVFFIFRMFFNSSRGLGFLFGGTGLYYYTIWCANYLVVESLYVCMGFGLYLNSRVEVEGWDIELLFRKFTTRYRKAGVLVLLLFGLGLPRLTGVFGQSPGSGPLPPDLGAAMPSEALEEILKRDMGGERKTWGIRFKDEDKDEPAGYDYAPFPWANFFRNAGAVVLRAVLILAFAALALACGVFVYRRRKGPRPFHPNQPPDQSPRNVPAPAPERLLDEAGRAYRRGSIREAWGLCYAASLNALTRYHSIRFPPGATEYRCLALLRRRQNDRLAGFERAFADLIRHWVALAYGGISPPGGAFEEALAWALSLCGVRETPAPENARGSGGVRG